MVMGNCFSTKSNVRISITNQNIKVIQLGLGISDYNYTSLDSYTQKCDPKKLSELMLVSLTFLKKEIREKTYF